MNVKIEKYDEVEITDAGKLALCERLPQDTPGQIFDIVAGITKNSHFYVQDFRVEDGEELAVLYSIAFSESTDSPLIGIVTLPTKILEKKTNEASGELISEMTLFKPEFWAGKLRRMVEIEDFNKAHICREIINLIHSTKH